VGGTGDGGIGGDSTFAGTVVVAKGGAGGTGVANGIAGLGSVVGGVGDVVYAGGSGADGLVTTNCRASGSGGGGAGSAGAGGDATGNTGGTGTAAGGGAGGNASNGSSNGASGTVAGGGGAGACAESNTTRSGGAGASGQVLISYASMPTATTNPATTLVTTSVTLNGSVNDNGGDTTVTFDYGTTTAYGSSITAAPGTLAANTGNTAVTAFLSGLACNTTYHFQVNAVNAAGTAIGADRTFTTTCAVPAATTAAATLLTTTGATLNGTINDNGTSTAIYFDYGTTTGYGTTLLAPQSPLAANSGVSAISASVSGLPCGATYHYRIRGTNAIGAGIGADMTFATAACPSASVSVTANPATCVNAVGVGSIAWTALNATLSDDLYATTSLNDNQQSNYLKCTGYGFTIPTSATISGITVNVERNASNTPIKDLEVRTVKAGAIGTVDRSTATQYPTTDTIEAHGGPTDLWGTTWTAADINNVNFGAALAAQKAGANGGARTVNVDHMPITVDYTRGVPWVESIDRTSANPTAANKSVTWDVLFSGNATGVDASDFVLGMGGAATGATITSVTGSGQVWTVTANTGTGATGTLRLNLVDDDSIKIGGVALGGAGNINGDFTGQAYTIEVPVCDGTAIYCDDFERSNPGAVGNGWTVTPGTVANCAGVTGNSGCAGIDSDIPPFDGTTTLRPNPTRAMFTRWNVVSVDSPVIDLSGHPSALLSFWMRRGGDAFSEYPEAVGEDYLVKYFANDGTWKVLAQYPTGVMQGQVFNPVIQLPQDAMHAGFKLQFFQPAGSGDGRGRQAAGSQPGIIGYDYWHFDNIIIREAPESSYVGPFCDNFEAGLGRWSISAEGAPLTAAIGDALLGATDFSSASHELDMRWGYVSVSTLRTNMVGVTGNIDYWVKSGTTPVRAPDVGEDLVVEYRNDVGLWKTLATYTSTDATAGTIYNGSHVMPDDAKHAGFRLRFRQLNGSGSLVDINSDYWHVDDVCVGTIQPNTDLSVGMTRSGQLVPGSTATYTISVTNHGPDTLAGTIEVTDSLPAGLSYSSASGTGWVCSSNPPDVACSYVGTVPSGGVVPPVTLTVVVDPNAAGTISNTVTVTGTGLDANPANDSATDVGNIIVATRLAEFHMDEVGWNGTVGELKDTAGYASGPFNGAAIGTPKPTAALSTPARGGNPGTCSYATLPGTATDAGAFAISGLPVSAGAGSKTSVAFWMYWDGTDNVMPIGWNEHGLLLQGGYFGFNTGTSDIYGISSAGLANGWHHVVAVFTNDSVDTNLLYIDGVSQVLSQVVGAPNLATAIVDSTLRLGGWGLDNNYRFSGNLDEVLVFKDALVQSDVTALYGETHACAAAVDHYELSLPTSSISCLESTATVTACANNSNPCTQPSTLINGYTATLSSSAGTLGSTTLSFDATGVASTTLSHPAVADGTPVTVTLVGATAAAVNSAKCCPDGANCVAVSSCDTSFNTAGFIFSSAVDGAEATLPSQVAGVSSGTFYLRAVTTNTTTKACEAGLTGESAVEFAYECKNPTTCYSGNLLNIAGGTPAASTTIARNNDGGGMFGYNYTPVNLTFDANGNAPFSFSYDDVGQVNLWVKKTLTATSPITAATLEKTSNAFVVKPAGFKLSAIKRTSDNLVNPAAADATGSKFAKAGEDFSVTVTALTASGSTAFSYGNETIAEGVSLQAQLASGLGLSNNPGLVNATSFGTFSNGVATGSTFSWNEVGIITLIPGVGDGTYLGAGNTQCDPALPSYGGATACPPSGNVGRFYPASFTLTPGAIANRTDIAACDPAGCGTFTYMGEEMKTSFTLTAVAVDPTKTTQNYSYSATPENNFAKLDPLAAVVAGTGGPLVMDAVDIGVVRTPIHPCNGATPVHPCFSTSQATAGAFATGVADVIVPLTVFRDAVTPSTPFSALDFGIAPLDSDGVLLFAYDLDTVDVPPVTSNHGKVGRTEVRYGRLKVSSAYGSELLPLTVTATAQYFTAGGWLPSVTDSVTPLTLAATYNVVKGAVVKGTTTPGPTGATVLNLGQRIIQLGKPTAGGNGSATITPIAPGYMPVTSGTVTFGIFKGNNNFIYQREAY
jgi:uncharacterized repeat protein (TIGR01451 family)